MKPVIAPLVALGAFFVSIISLAQELPVTQPEAVGMSSARLQRIASAVQQSIDEHRIAGAVTMIVRHGQVAWLDAHRAWRTAKRASRCSLTRCFGSAQ